jgi:hypothetical protein
MPTDEKEREEESSDVEVNGGDTFPINSATESARAVITLNTVISLFIEHIGLFDVR